MLSIPQALSKKDMSSLSRIPRLTHNFDPVLEADGWNIGERCLVYPVRRKCILNCHFFD